MQEFLHAAPSSGGTTQVIVQKSISSWAEECEDDDDRPSRSEIIELPTAPRAARILDDDSIPYTGPFSARVSNLPFDTNEQDIDEFFVDRNIRVKEMRLARDDANDRLRGFGHIEFEEREDLINALMMSDAMIRNRRIRIELASEHDQRDGRTVRKRYDNYVARDPTSNESTNWRERKESNFEQVDSREPRRGGGGFQSRSNFQNRHDTNNNDNNDDGGNWRMGERANESPPPERRRNFGSDRDRRGGDRRDRYGDRHPEPEEERPVLNLQPRTIPLPVLEYPEEKPSRKVSSLNGDAENHNDSGLPEDEEKEVSAPPPPKPKPVPSVNIFGQAKPVDTAAREREIEEKLEHEREAKIQREKEEREKERLEAENAPPEVEMKKDVIVIRTEKARQQEEAVNWRKHDEPSDNGPAENRIRDNGRRFEGRRSKQMFPNVHILRQHLEYV